MDADLFISYAWTSAQHREWVRQLAASMGAIGYDVLIDANVDYGDSLSGFMSSVVEARHVLMIADDNYIERANDLPDTGVGIENRWISQAHPEKPPTWLSVLFKDNPTASLPAWLTDHNPKSHRFNARPEKDEFPGPEQVDALWRWIEDLPSNRGNATQVETYRKRAARLERSTLQRDSGRWSSPAIAGEVHFQYVSAPRNTYRIGCGDSEFSLMVSERGVNTVAVYADPIKAVGLVRSGVASPSDLAAHLTPGRVVDAAVGDAVVLLNQHGVLCRVEILRVQREVNGSPYVAPFVDFRYEVGVEG